MCKQNKVNDELLVVDIKNSEWIDLSIGHEQVRKSLEKNIENSCVNKMATSPTMVKGAFRIGKTALLSYLFHYSWTTLSVPAFLLDLDDIIIKVKEYLNKNTYLEKLPNKDLNTIVEGILSEQINLLKGNLDNIENSKLYFPDFKYGRINDYLKGFTPAILHTRINGDYEDHNLSMFNLDVINKAVNSNNKYLLLIDEFEAKYHELNSLMEESGGGALRELFTNVSSSESMYYCIIGNGPASGYELHSGINYNKTSNSAEQGRLHIKQIQMPTVSSLSKTFLSGFKKEYINFIWWLSRSRAGQIKKLKSDLQPYEELKNHNYITFITENDKVFNEPIDDFGEKNVTFLKTDIFELLPIKMKNYVKDFLVDLGPNTIDVTSEDSKKLFDEYKEYFYASSELTHKDDIIQQLQNDIQSIKETTMYSQIKFDVIHKYFELILSSLSDINGMLVFGVINKEVNRYLSEIFLTPLFSNLYDFITIYEDEHDSEVKLILNFIQELIHKSENEKKDVDVIFSNCYDLFEEGSVKLKRKDEIFIQLNLHTIREAIEQPIGSPKLPYKSESLENKVAEVSSIDKIFIWAIKQNEEIIIIPDYSDDELLQSYLETLKEYFENNWNKDKNYFGNGKLITNIVYLEKNGLVDEFKKWLCFNEDEEELPFRLKRLDLRHIEDYQIHDSLRMSDYISSLVKIATVGLFKKDISDDRLKNYSDEEGDPIVRVDKIINLILEGGWTESKQTRRTIEYYRDLLLSGENSVFNQVINVAKDEYLKSVSEFIKEDSLQDYSYSITLSDSEHLQTINGSIATKNFISFLLGNNKETDFGDTLSFIKKISIQKLYPDNKEQDLTIPEIDYFLNKKHKDKIEKIITDFSMDDKESKGINRYLKLIASYDDVNSIDDFIELLTEESLIVNSYFAYLKYSPNKSYYLKGLYFRRLASILEKEDYVDQLRDKLDDKKNTLGDLSRSLSEEYEDLKELYDLNNDIIEEEDVDNYFTKIISPYLSGLNKDSSISYIVVGNYINNTIDIKIKKIQSFFNQIKKLNEIIKPKSDKIKQIQSEINKLYDIESDLLVSLFKDKYPNPRNGNFLYKTIFLQSIKNTDGGEYFDKIFEHEYSTNGKYLIEGENLNKLEDVIENSFNNKENSMHEILNELKIITNGFRETETLENKICDLLGFQPEILDIDEFDLELEVEQLSMEFDIDDISRKYDTALLIKKETDSTIIDGVFQENKSKENWEKLENQKETIDTAENYGKYQKDLCNYFSELYKAITAPGVKKLIDWIYEIDVRDTISSKKYKWIEKYLIDEYTEYRDEIESILQNILVLDSKTNGLFNGIKKKIKENIFKILDNYEEENEDEFKQDFEEFIIVFHSLLSDISNIEEMNYIDVEHFYTEKQTYLSEESLPVIDEELEFHADLIIRLVERNDEISTDKSQVTLKNIAELVGRNIEDINESIKLLRSLNLSQETDDNINNLYNKFEKSIQFKYAGSCAKELGDAIENSWEVIIQDYSVIENFFKDYKEVEVVNLLQNENQWESIHFPRSIKEYLIGLQGILFSNPVESILMDDIDKIQKQFRKKCKSIDELEEDELVKDITNYCNNIEDDYNNKKIKILEKLNENDENIQSIKENLESIQSFSESLTSEDNLLNYLASTLNGFIDLVIKNHEQYLNLLENSPIKDDLPFLDMFDKSGDGENIDNQFLIDNIEIIKRLLELDLISLTGKKNV